MNQKKSKDLSKKKLREQQVLLGLVELYLEMGKPIGSNSLREHGFQELSSATIRNYFSDLETQGYLRQPHASGGRVPTNSALRLYAQKVLEEALLTPDVEEKLRPLEELPSRHLMRYLQNGAEILSQVTGYATFFSSVRFDHDLILEIKLVGIDNERILCVIITNFGEVFTEILHINTPSHPELLTQIQSYIQLKIKGDQNAEKLNSPLAQKVYNEIMVRYLVRYSNFSDEDIYRTGFSHLLAYPEFHDPVALTTSLSLFENSSHMRLLLHDCMQEGSLRFWVGKDLAPYASAAQGCTVIAVPYRIGTTTVGAVGILGPCRMPYKHLFGTLNHFSSVVSTTLTKSLTQFKLAFRKPRSGASYLEDPGCPLVSSEGQNLLEIKERS